MTDKICIDPGESDCEILETHWVIVEVNAPGQNGAFTKQKTRIMLHLIEFVDAPDVNVVWGTNSINIGGISPMICAPLGTKEVCKYNGTTGSESDTSIESGKRKIADAINQTIARIVEDMRGAALRQQLANPGGMPKGPRPTWGN